MRLVFLCLEKCVLRLCHPKITYNHILFIWASWQQDHAISLLQKIWNVLGNKDYIDVKISHFPHIFFIISRDTWYSSKKKFVTSVFLKTVIELICDWNFKKTHPSIPKNFLKIWKISKQWAGDANQIFFRLLPSGQCSYPICYVKCQNDVLGSTHPPTPENVRCDQIYFLVEKRPTYVP